MDSSIEFNLVGVMKLLAKINTPKVLPSIVSISQTYSSTLRTGHCPVLFTDMGKIIIC